METDKGTAPQLKPADEQAASQLDFIYSSAVEMFSNAYDLRIVFGDRKPNMEIDRKCAVVLSHRHAKALSTILAKQIKHLEETFGEIAMGPIVGGPVPEEQAQEPVAG